MKANESERVERLVSRLLTAVKTTPVERAIIAALADRGVVGRPGFISDCVRGVEPPYVGWRDVERWSMASDDGAWIQTQAAKALSEQGYDETSPPQDADALQVVLDLDDPKGWVVAAWRDAYADRDRSLEVDMCLEYLTNQHLCWDCGDLGVGERDDLLWCVACAHKEKK